MPLSNTLENNLQLSKYNVVEYTEDGALVYNTNSGAILKLNNTYKDKFNLLMKTQITEDTELKRTLIHGKMLVNQTYRDETTKLFLENTISRFSGNHVGLTIAPTMACNFRCPYCYEKGKEYATMTPETIAQMKKYIQNLKNSYKRIHITWYGGEPLMAFDIIKELMEEVYQNFDKKYVSSGAVSNGYLLTENIVSDLKSLNINRIQITIDGPPEIHNTRRCLPSGDDTFYVILNNLKKALELYPELHVSIRVNVDKSNII